MVGLNDARCLALAGILRHGITIFVRMVCAVGFAGLLNSAYAANNGYGVKGAGVASCRDYAQAFDNKSPDLANFGGWIDGFVTGLNRAEPNTFDFAPWQSTEVLAHALARFCRGSPQFSFHEAVLALAGSLKADRLTSSTEVVVAREGSKAVMIYQAVLQRVRQELAARGFLQQVPSGQFGDETSEALKAFQRRFNLVETGLPDQNTLLKLFQPKD